MPGVQGGLGCTLLLTLTLVLVLVLPPLLLRLLLLLTPREEWPWRALAQVKLPWQGCLLFHWEGSPVRCCCCCRDSPCHCRVCCCLACCWNWRMLSSLPLPPLLPPPLLLRRVHTLQGRCSLQAAQAGRMQLGGRCCCWGD